MRQVKILVALAMLLALLTFNVEVQAKGGRSGGGSRSSGGHRSSSSSGGFFSGWGRSKSKSSSSSNSGSSHSSSSHSSGGGLFSNWGKSKTPASSSTSHSSHSKPHKTDLNNNHAGANKPQIGWNVDGIHNSHAHKPIKPSHIGNSHHGKPHHTHHVSSYPRQPVFMASNRPGAPPPPPPSYGGYYESSNSLPVGAVYYPQVPRTSSDPGFGTGFFAGAYGQSILNRLSHAHYHGHHSTVIHHHHSGQNENNNNGGKTTVIIINNNATTAGDMQGANITTPLGAGEQVEAQLTPIQPVLTNDLANAPDTINPPPPTDATATAAMNSSTVDTLGVDLGVDVNASTTAATLSDNNSIAAANDIANNSIDTAAAAPPAPGGIICFPSMVNETDAQDPSKVVQVEKIFCFPAEPTEAIAEELSHQAPEQPNILNEDVNNATQASKSGPATKGSFQFAGFAVLLLLLSFN